MSRLSYSEDEDFSGQFALWQANCHRSMHGKAGQQSLRELEAALLALPAPRLTRGALCQNGDVCAVGAMALYRRVQAGEDRAAVLADLANESGEIDDDYGDSGHQTDEYAEGVLGTPKLVAWKIVEQNDIMNDVVWEVALGPVAPHHGSYKGGVPHIRPMAPEERYERVLAWVRQQLEVSK